VWSLYICQLGLYVIHPGYNTGVSRIIPVSIARARSRGRNTAITMPSQLPATGWTGGAQGNCYPEPRIEPARSFVCDHKRPWQLSIDKEMRYIKLQDSDGLTTSGRACAMMLYNQMALCTPCLIAFE